MNVLLLPDVTWTLAGLIEQPLGFEIDTVDQATWIEPALFLPFESVPVTV